MAAESFAVNIWLQSFLSANEDLLEILGEPFNTAGVIKRNTTYQINNANYVPIVSNDHTYKVKVAGKTSISEPTFNETTNSLTNDGTVVWQESGSVGIRPRIFEGVAPQEAKEPLIVYNLQTPSSTKKVGMGSEDLFSNLMYQVKGIDRGNDKTQLARIASLINDILSIGEGEGGSEEYQVEFNNKNYQIMGSYREDIISYSEVVDDDTFNHMGGLYNILVRVL